MNTTTRTILAIIMVLVIMLCSILIASKVLGRARLADLTAYNLYTLSDGTKNIIGKLNQPVLFRLYYSRIAAMKGPEQIRFWNNYYLYVRDLLEEYVNRSDGKIVLEIIDPRPFSEEEEEAISKGVKRFQLSEEESFFFGMVARTELGREKVIKFFEPNRQEFVEYDISKILSELMEREKRKVGVISPLPVAGTDMSPYMMQMLQMQGKQPEKPWAIIEHMRQAYEVEKVEIKDASIPDDIDFLMVVHPKEFKKEELFAIDQFVMKGGKLIVFADPHCMLDQPEQNPQNPYAAMTHVAKSELPILKKWGVKMDSQLIAVDSSLATVVQLSRDKPPQKFSPYLTLDDSCFNREMVVTANLHKLKMLYSGVLDKPDTGEITFTPLLYTSSKGNKWKPANPFELNMPDPVKILNAVKDGDKPQVLAAAYNGKFVSNYPEGIDVEKEAEKTEGGEENEKKEVEKIHYDAIRESAEDAAIVVVADADILTDHLCYQQTFFGMAQSGDNAPFVFNLFEYLAGSGDLIAIRTRGSYGRPFKVVEQIEQEADRATAEEVEKINTKIKAYQDQLKQLGDAANNENVKLIKNETMEKRRKIETEIRAANKELRRLQAKRREKVEQLAFNLQLWNMVGAPSIILIIAISLAVFRWKRAKSYAARRI